MKRAATRAPERHYTLVPDYISLCFKYERAGRVAGPLRAWPRDSATPVYHRF